MQVRIPESVVDSRLKRIDKSLAAAIILELGRHLKLPIEEIAVRRVVAPCRGFYTILPIQHDGGYRRVTAFINDSQIVGVGIVQELWIE